MNSIKYLTFQDLSAYKKSYKLSNIIWDVVIKWNYLAKETVGKQFIRSVDSISVNIAEGFGRYHKKDKIKFYYNSRASALEALDWLQKATDRNLINSNESVKIKAELKELPLELNQLVKYTNRNLTI
jgi:four helix bundle protein